MPSFSALRNNIKEKDTNNIALVKYGDFQNPPSYTFLQNEDPSHCCSCCFCYSCNFSFQELLLYCSISGREKTVGRKGLKNVSLKITSGQLSFHFSAQWRIQGEGPGRPEPLFCIAKFDFSPDY